MMKIAIATGLVLASLTPAQADGRSSSVESAPFSRTKVDLGADFSFVEDEQVSADGSTIVFTGRKGDSSQPTHAYAYHVPSKRVERIDVTVQGTDASGVARVGDVSADGRYVAFVSSAPNIVVRDLNGKPDAFVRDRLKRRTVRVSLTDTGKDLLDGVKNDPVTLSPDGRVAVFKSTSEVVRGVPKSQYALLIHGSAYARFIDRGRTVPIAYGNGRLGDVWGRVAISRGGSVFAFDSWHPLTRDEPQQDEPDLYIWSGGTLRAITQLPDRSGTKWSKDTDDYVGLSADGRHVAFGGSRAGEVGSTSRALIRDLKTNTVVDTAEGWLNPDGDIRAMTPDGSGVVYNPPRGSGPEPSANPGGYSIYYFDVKKRTHTRVESADPVCNVAAEDGAQWMGAHGKLLYKSTSVCDPTGAYYLLTIT